MALLAPVVAAGALLGHGVGYGVGGVVGTTDHRHLALAWPAVSVLAAGACLLLAVRQLRRTGVGVGLGPLAVGHVVAYLGLESIEALATSPVDHLTSTGFLLGLLLQPVVAVAVWRLLDAGFRLLASPRRGSSVTAGGRSSSVVLADVVEARFGPPLGAPRRRGPPQLV